MHYKLITPPETYPVTVNEVKEALGYYCDEDNDKIEAYIAAAVDYAQDYQRKRVYVAQTWELYLNSFSNKIELPKIPVQNIESITCKDSTGTETTIDAADYILSNEGYIVPAYGKYWPSFTPFPVEPITIRFVAGYAEVDDIPDKIKQAIILLVKYFDYVDLHGADKIADSVLQAAERLLWMDRAW